MEKSYSQVKERIDAERIAIAGRRRLNKTVTARLGELDRQARLVGMMITKLDGKEPKEWSESALCRVADPEIFFDTRQQSEKLAKAVCAVCIVRNECLEENIREQEDCVVGGMNKAERTKLLRRSARRQTY